MTYATSLLYSLHPPPINPPSPFIHLLLIYSPFPLQYKAKGLVSNPFMKRVSSRLGIRLLDTLAKAWGTQIFDVRLFNAGTMTGQSVALPVCGWCGVVSPVFEWCLIVHPPFIFQCHIPPTRDDYSLPSSLHPVYASPHPLPTTPRSASRKYLPQYKARGPGRRTVRLGAGEMYKHCITHTTLYTLYNTYNMHMISITDITDTQHSQPLTPYYKLPFTIISRLCGVCDR